MKKHVGGQGTAKTPIGGGSGLDGERAESFVGTWKKLFDYCREYRVNIIIAFVCVMASTVWAIFGPRKLSEMTDYIGAGLVRGAEINADKVLEIAIFLVVLFLFSFVVSALQNWLMAAVTQKASKQLRSDVSQKINRLPLSYFTRTSTGDLLSRITNDIDTIAQSMSQSLGNLLTSSVLFFGSLVMMLLTDLVMALAAVLSTLLGCLLVLLIMKTSQSHFLAQQIHLGDLNGYIEEIYSGHTVVKAYNGEAAAALTFLKLNESLRDSGFKAQMLSGLMMPVMAFIGNLGYVVVCVTGGVLVLNKSIGFGIVVAFMLYVRNFTTPLTHIAQAIQNMQAAAAAGERVFQLLEEEEMEDESAKQVRLGVVKGDVSFRHVRFGYEGNTKNVINDFSMHAGPGQKIAIVGPTGAGKTTLVNLLMRFYEIQSGDIKIDGVSTREVTRENVHAQFCLVLQDTWLFEGTIRENLIYSAEGISDRKMFEASKAVGLHHFIQTLPKGYDTVLNEQVSLSLGQKQQITIARAMITDRPMLILDEATSSVDTRTEMIIQKAMDELMKNRTSFVIAHRLSTIKNADLILVLKEGDVIESGTHEELLAQNGFYAELYLSQFENAVVE